MYDIIELNGKLLSELKDIAKKLNVPKYDLLKKQELIYKILDQQALNPQTSDKIAPKKVMDKKKEDESPGS